MNETRCQHGWAPREADKNGQRDTRRTCRRSGTVVVHRYPGATCIELSSPRRDVTQADRNESETETETGTAATSSSPAGRPAIRKLPSLRTALSSRPSVPVPLSMAIHVTASSSWSGTRSEADEMSLSWSSWHASMSSTIMHHCICHYLFYFCYQHTIIFINKINNRYPACITSSLFTALIACLLALHRYPGLWQKASSRHQPTALQHTEGGYKCGLLARVSRV
jgi:hypothetical protein